MSREKILVVDTQIVGHHVLWLCMVSKVMLANQQDVVLLVNQNIDEVRKRISQIDSELLSMVSIEGANLSKSTNVKGYFAKIEDVFLRNSCSKIIFNNFDTISSKLFRRAAWGYTPPCNLHGKMFIIYHRPRPLDSSHTSLSEAWKRRGLRKLIEKKVFANILLLDPFLVNDAKQLYGSSVNINFIPDPWLGNPEVASCPPELNPDNNIKILQYGVGDKRKGTELLLDALEGIKQALPITLIIAGVQKTAIIKDRIANLQSRHSIVLVDRFISNSEEKYLFQHADYIAIPYLSHYGSSNILSKAVQYAKPVIASDYHLIGKIVNSNKLGVLFSNQDEKSLADVLLNLGHGCSSYENGIANYRDLCSFQRFHDVLTLTLKN